MDKEDDQTDAEFYRMDDPSHGTGVSLADGVAARLYMGANSMLSIASFGPNARSTVHKHPEEQWGVLLEGDGIRIQNGVEYRVTTGDFWRTPGDVPHGFAAGPAGAKILDIFSPPRDIYRKASESQEP